MPSHQAERVAREREGTPRGCRLTPAPEHLSAVGLSVSPGLVPALLLTSQDNVLWLRPPLHLWV